MKTVSPKYLCTIQQHWVHQSWALHFTRCPEYLTTSAAGLQVTRRWSKKCAWNKVCLWGWWSDPWSPGWGGRSLPPATCGLVPPRCPPVPSGCPGTLTRPDPGWWTWSLKAQKDKVFSSFLSFSFSEGFCSMYIYTHTHIKQRVSEGDGSGQVCVFGGEGESSYCVKWKKLREKNSKARNVRRDHQKLYH